MKMRYGLVRCQLGLDAARKNLKEATTDEEKQKWQKLAQVWKSRLSMAQL